MKKIQFFILIFLCNLLPAQSIPDTNVFSLSDVVAVTGGTSLSAAFSASVDSLFDVRYKGVKNSLYNFRNYHGVINYSNLIYVQTLKTQTPDTTHYDFVASTNPAYISLGVDYDSLGTTLSKPFVTYPEMQVYDTLMNQTGFRSLWLGGVNIPTSLDTVTINTNLVFDSAYTVQVGIIGDNYYTFTLNDSLIYSTGYSTPTYVNFKYLHFYPVTVKPGNNSFSFIGLGDGYVDQALGIIILQNTKAQVFDNPDSTTWNMLFSTENLIGSGTTYICSTGYSYNSNSAQCEKISDISTWSVGDQTLISFAFPQSVINEINSWSLDFGDTNSTSGTTFNPLVSHTYAASGSYTVVLSAHLTIGGSISATQIITLP